MNWTLYSLQENFRCCSEVCRVANALMASQPGRLPKQTISATGETGEVIVNREGFETDDAEAHAVADDILKCVCGTLANECAVLVRTNHLVEYFRNVLKAHGLPVREKAKADLPADWARAKAALALLANPDNDRLAFQAVRLSAGQQKADEVRRAALDNYRSINDMALFLQPGMLAGQALDQLAKMNISRESLDRIGKAAAMLPPDSHVTALVLAVASRTRDEVEGDGLRVSTIHSAKGTEATAVWLPAVESSLFPCPNEAEPESRRLLFVGITRTRSHLWLSWAKKRATQWKGVVDCQPSRFLKEIEP